MGKVVMDRAAIAAHLQAHGLDIGAAAAALGVSHSTLRQRMRRHGVRRDALVLLRHGVSLPVQEGEAVINPEGESVRLTLGDYATLQTQAAQGREAARLARELARSESIIATLTRHLEGFAAQAVAAVLLVLALAGPAVAQYTPDQLRELQPVALAVGEATRDAYPAAWRNAHAMGEPQGSEFVRRWALALKARGIVACVNGKRGTDTLSQDVLVFPVTSGGNRDTSGQYAQIAIIDVIGGAGGPNPTLGWGDVSAASQGKCIAPYLEPGEGGSTPPPGGGSTPPPTPTAPAVDLRPVLDALARVEARQAALEERIAALDFSQPIDYAALDEFVRAMVGGGPDGDGPLPNHVTDLLQRLDVIRVTLEQLNGFLRSRAVLRY